MKEKKYKIFIENGEMRRKLRLGNKESERIY